MRFYTKTHIHYCGIDLHAKTMSLCILDRKGHVLLHKSIRCHPNDLLRAFEPFRDHLVVAVECIFTGYGLADLRRREGPGDSQQNRSDRWTRINPGPYDRQEEDWQQDPCKLHPLARRISPPVGTRDSREADEDSHKTGGDSEDSGDRKTG